MAISDLTRKLLWGDAAKRCAICRTTLSRTPTGSNHPTIVGEECHIVAQGTKGPRAGEPIPGGALDSEPNLLLLCRIDHRLVDDQPEVYTVERLLEIKRTHQRWVDEALQAAQAPTRGSPKARAALKRLLRESLARCVERWQALGLDEELADAFARDQSLGALSEGALGAGAVTVLTGDPGAGKSLAGDRLHQADVERAVADDAAPTPVWFRARDARDLGTAVSEALRPLGADSADTVLSLVLDGLDELGPAGAAELLSAARRLAHARPGSRVVATTRLLSDVGNRDERRSLPLLELSEAEQLVKRISRRDWLSLHGSAPAICDAVRRPFFAIALGRVMAEEGDYRPSAPAEVIDRLVRHALGDTWPEVSEPLSALAVQSLHRDGGPVRAADLIPNHALAALLQTRLVVEDLGHLRFPLIIFAQWFAAQSIAYGGVDINGLLDEPAELEVWRYPLAIAVATAPASRAWAIMDRLVRRAPAMASLIIKDAVQQYGEGAIKIGDWRAAGEAVRSAEMAWVEGLGPLAAFVAPVEDGELAALAARVEGNRLTTVWYRGEQPRSPVFELAADVFLLDAPPGYGPGRWANPPSGPAWAWRWTQHEIGRGIQELIKARGVPLLGTALEHEAVWAVALAALGHGGLRAEPVDIRPLLDLKPSADAVVSGNRIMPITGLRDALTTHVAGDGLLHAPWPTPDSPSTDTWIWSDYSCERIRERAEAIYGAALQTYEQVAATLFRAVAERLRTAVVLPATARGFVSFSDRGHSLGEPMLAWWLEPLEAGEVQTSASFALGDSRSDQDRLSSLDDRLKTGRPQAARWIQASMERTVLHGIFGAAPAAQLLHGWLWNDLKALGFFGGTQLSEWPYDVVPLLESLEER